MKTTKILRQLGYVIAGLCLSINWPGIQSFAAPNLIIDGAQMSQTIDGLGVNINVENWKSGQLKPALNYLIDDNGSTLYRVSRDPIDWVNSESLIPALHALDSATLQQVYETRPMRDIWETLLYLNQKGIKGKQIVLNFMGWTPTWLGGSGRYGTASYITSGKETQFATMIASLVYYARRVKNLDFVYLSPMNEQDWNCLEGPCVSAAQYTTILRSLATELNSMGVTEVRFAGPDTAGSGSDYITRMMGDSVVASRTDHLAFHTYSGAVSPGTAYSGKNYWLTETSSWCSTCDAGQSEPSDEWGFATQTVDYILGDIANGLAAVLIWEGYDGFWYHHDASSLWGLLHYNAATGIYTPRKRLYAYGQIFRFVSPGDKVISSTDTISKLGTCVAVYNQATGKVSIVSRNTGSTAIAIEGQLLNLPSITSLALYQTSRSTNLTRVTDVPVASNLFSVQIPANTIFSLVNKPSTSSRPEAPGNLRILP